ncbi:hypothetical protein ROA7023_02725 [Roseisalinus antarcticus]|uniref:N-acetyltransferase domain-containing protein n=2 Tax=Roseisalinus antarcticus TaxID=254357 RepID=A0A1Y5TA87_9RHOB|nr:hypothetical protein ROA7023_02725 [Roseisalinus antarcticus]
MTPELRTGRLVLRGLQPGDAPVIARLLNDLEVSRWLRVVPFPYSAGMAREFIATARPPGQHVWALTRNDTPLGVIGLEEDLGYWLGRAHWGQGLMAEAAAAVVAHWHTDSIAPALRSGHFPGNDRSRAILLRLGFRDGPVEPVQCRASGGEVALQRMVLERADDRG